MKAIRAIFAAITAVALALCIVGLGLLVCILPPVTHGLSSMFALDDLSPFDRNQLVRVADATRDFSFGNHDELALYQVIYGVDEEFEAALKQANGRVPSDFPALAWVTDRANVGQYRQAFSSASELYCYSADTISHLDDCYALFASGRTALIVAAVLAIAGLVFTGVTGKSRWLGTVLMASGIVVVVSFIGLGIWAAVDFTGFFAAFHQLFFAQQGNWLFPYDSLLICSLPQSFWMGMGGICLAIALVVSALLAFIGRKIRR